MQESPTMPSLELPNRLAAPLQGSRPMVCLGPAGAMGVGLIGRMGDTLRSMVFLGFASALALPSLLDAARERRAPGARADPPNHGELHGEAHWARFHCRPRVRRAGAGPARPVWPRSERVGGPRNRGGAGAQRE